MLTDLRDVLTTLELIPPPPQHPQLIPPPAFNHPENMPVQDLLELGKNIHLKYMYMYTQHIPTENRAHPRGWRRFEQAPVFRGPDHCPWTLPLLALCGGSAALRDDMWEIMPECVQMVRAECKWHNVIYFSKAYALQEVKRRYPSHDGQYRGHRTTLEPARK